jgi:hypothetical protein
VVLVGRTSHANCNPFDLSFVNTGKEPRCRLVGRLDAKLGPRRDVTIACLPADPFRVLMSIPVARVFRVYIYRETRMTSQPDQPVMPSWVSVASVSGIKLRVEFCRPRASVSMTSTWASYSLITLGSVCLGRSARAFLPAQILL